MKRLLIFAMISTLFACEDNMECRSLKRVLDKNQKVLQRAQRRAAQGERIKERLTRAKTKADEVLQKLGLDKSETDTHVVLEARSKKLGVKLVRGTRDLDPLTSQGKQATETQWTFNFPAKSLTQAHELVNQLIAIPPFVRFVGMSPPSKNSKEWRVDVTRGLVDRAPMDLKPTGLPPRDDGSKVKSEMGFCGAGDLRAEIASVNKQILAVEDQAAQMTVDLPMSASWEGIWRRAEVIRDIELESRRMVDELIKATVAKKLKLKAIGVERDVVIIEVFGGPKQKGQLEQGLPTEMVEKIQAAPTEAPGFARLMLINRTAERKRQEEERIQKVIQRRKKQKQP